MTIHLTPEQERRIPAVLRRGAYESIDKAVEAALTGVEQRTVPGFSGTPEELGTLLAEGLASKATHGRSVLEFCEQSNGCPPC